MPSGGGAAPASSSLDVLGVLSALTVGLCGGSILVPASLVITPAQIHPAQLIKSPAQLTQTLTLSGQAHGL
jgi:hypothetical protein